jgi:D-glycero-D-manno-heptose 1,7-bisphosphate phosphatase
MGFSLVVVTNQAGIARGMYTPADFHELMVWVSAHFARAGAPLAGVYFCPHHAELGLGEYRLACRCRKPAPGMLLDAVRDLGLDPARSVMFGDKLDDMRAAQAAGVLQRIWLAKDGGALPDGEAPAGLVSRRYRSLAGAMADAEFLESLKQ